MTGLPPGSTLNGQTPLVLIFSCVSVWLIAGARCGIRLLICWQRGREDVPDHFVPFTGSVNPFLFSFICPVEDSTFTACIQPNLFFLFSRSKVFRSKKVLGEYDIKVEQVNYYTRFIELRCCRIFSKRFRTSRRNEWEIWAEIYERIYFTRQRGFCWIGEKLKYMHNNMTLWSTGNTKRLY